VGTGYRNVEYEMIGRRLGDRIPLQIEAVEVLKQAWTGEPFEFRGRTVRVTPTPAQRPRPQILLGGSSRRAARRAARIADGFDPNNPVHWEEYRKACLELGRDPGPWPPRGPNFLYVSRDPDAAWARIGPYVLWNNNTYTEWKRENPGHTDSPFAEYFDLDQLRKSAYHRIVTPEECVVLARTLGPTGMLRFDPLCGGIEPELAWESLELFATEVLPLLDQRLP
jgi:alkanesulfonate monooxygenase SsuD/methylene tetrahydromethanopterin reductase-like flavin-dependent oxidoreductase (luciferase family)